MQRRGLLVDTHLQIREGLADWLDLQILEGLADLVDVLDLQILEGPADLAGALDLQILEGPADLGSNLVDLLDLQILEEPVDLGSKNLEFLERYIERAFLEPCTWRRALVHQRRSKSKVGMVEQIQVEEPSKDKGTKSALALKVQQGRQAEAKSQRRQRCVQWERQ